MQRYNSKAYVHGLKFRFMPVKLKIKEECSHENDISAEDKTKEKRAWL